MVRHPGEYLIDEDSVTEATMAALQPPSVQGTELHAPESNTLVADRDTALSQDILDVAVAQVESIVKPDGVGDDLWRESVTLVGAHGNTLPASGHQFVSTLGNDVFHFSNAFACQADGWHGSCQLHLEADILGIQFNGSPEQLDC
jgi:hypothetical protein